MNLRWEAGGGLLPAIVQDAETGEVLMLGYMNEAALEATRATGRVTFYSRSKGRLWVKGETSGHFLEVRDISVDCDGDALLLLARPAGAVCHRGTRTCWGEGAPRAAVSELAGLVELERVISERAAQRDAQRDATGDATSYTASLLAAGPRRVAQKVGEEAVELALAAVGETDQDFLEEAADLLYHVLVLLRARGLTLGQVVRVLEGRRKDAEG